MAAEEQLAAVRQLVAKTGSPVAVMAPIIRNVVGAHHRLLSYLADYFGISSLELDGNEWDRQLPDPSRPHDILVHLGDLAPEDPPTRARSLLAQSEALGASGVIVRTEAEYYLSRAPVCLRCGLPLSQLRPSDLTHNDNRVQAYRLGGLSLPQVLALAVNDARGWFADLALPPHAERLAAELERRLRALHTVGLGYLSLDRTSPSLARGEAQRVRLAMLLANRIGDLLHVLDEPSIGLEPKQAADLVEAIANLKGPILMVEHDPAAVALADEVIELGPGGGKAGGRLIFQGPPARLWESSSVSGRYFSGREGFQHATPAGRNQGEIRIRDAYARNLKGFDCVFRVGQLTVVTGPSGAGKTTLVRDVLAASLTAKAPCGCRGVEGPKLRTVVIDQAPIGRNPRSNPATYSGLAENLRRFFSRASGLPSSAFSFNQRAGRCPACEGIGAVEVKLPYLPSEWVPCESCQGKRYAVDTLKVRARPAVGKVVLNIAEVMDLTVSDVASWLAEDSMAARVIDALRGLGLDYLCLGQPSPTLSGGEAQRLKLARHLARARPGDLVIMDEPTSGLHALELTMLLAALRQLTGHGSTVVVIEHNPELIAAADWLVRLGPRGGPEGGRLIYSGPPIDQFDESSRLLPRAVPRARGRRESVIRIVGARAHNLKDVSIEIRKEQVVAVVGRSGSGKSSLVRDVLQAEANRRLLECLSMYERQSIREGPEAHVALIEGLGPTIFLGPDRSLFNPRTTVGTATSISHHLATLLAYLGERNCPSCAGRQRRERPLTGSQWVCDSCSQRGLPIEPRHFSPAAYEGACPTCGGVGTVPEPRPERLIVRPEAPLCSGAMYSPGFFPTNYLCRSVNGGYPIMLGLGKRYGFDPWQTPWRDMSEEARKAFLFGDSEPFAVRSDSPSRRGRMAAWRGFFRIVETWDVGGLYMEASLCPDCHGRRLRTELLDVRLCGQDRHQLHSTSLDNLEPLLTQLIVDGSRAQWLVSVTTAVASSVEFLRRMSLGYLHLDRATSTLSAGEAQRVKLASLLANELEGMTVLLDEPSRGLHPAEVEQVANALKDLTTRGNTVIVVEHDRQIVSRADELVVMGPGPGHFGGKVVAQGSVRAVERLAPEISQPLIGPISAHPGRFRRRPSGWMRVLKARENNLTGEDVAIPLGVLVGICGVSGSGKSTLAMDIVGRALSPVRVTTSVAYDPVQPGAHSGIEGAPKRAVVVDQSHIGIVSPCTFLGVRRLLRSAYAASDAALAAGLGEKDFTPRCDACAGKGVIREEMGFLGAIIRPCEACDETGYTAEVRTIRLHDRTLPDIEAMTLEELGETWYRYPKIEAALSWPIKLGIGYLALRQPETRLSGGEAQRLKLARELSRRISSPTLYILDEPSYGQHPLDLEPLVGALNELVDSGHSILMVEHDVSLLASCDWLIEMGPGGPTGGHVIAQGTPEEVAVATTPTARYLGQAVRQPR